jgi:hypothetical protein
MIHVFGDSYCDPLNGFDGGISSEKRWFNLLDEPSFVFGLAGSSIDWSLDVFLKGHNHREGKVIYIESIPRRFHFEFLQYPGHAGAVVFDDIKMWENDYWLSQPSMKYLSRHKKFIGYFHDNYKDYHKATKARCVLKALSEQYEKVIYFSTSHNKNLYNPVSIKNTEKFIIPDITLMDISQAEIKSDYDPSFKDWRSNHFIESNHKNLARYIKRIFNNESIEDIVFDTDMI